METLAMKAFSTASRLKMTRPVPPFQVFLPYPFQFATSQYVNTHIHLAICEADILRRTFGLCWGGTTLGDTTYFRACRYINSAKPDLSNGTRKDSRDWSHIMCWMISMWLHLVVRRSLWGGPPCSSAQIVKWALSLLTLEPESSALHTAYPSSFLQLLQVKNALS